MKRTLAFLAFLAYLGIFLVALVFMLKPGASFFYQKIQIPSNDIIPVDNAFEFSFNTDIRFYNPDTILLLESGHILDRVFLKEISSGEDGIFALKEISSSEINVLFIPTDFSEPSTNNQTYQVYIRPYFISSNRGGLAFILLLVGLAAFFAPLLNPKKRKMFLASPLDLSAWWVKTESKPNKLAALPRKAWIKNAITNIILVAFFYIFMEWLFLVTKPSFMDLYTLDEKVGVLLTTGLACAALSLLSLPVNLLIDVIFSSHFPAIRKYIYPLPSALLAACLSLILLDNFTYTIFGLGIVNSKTLVRVFYALVFTTLLVYFLKKFVPVTKKSAEKGQRIKAITAAALIALSLIFSAFTFNPINYITETGINSDTIQKPNIILLGIDGLNASSMSVYGYERNTTPFISELAKTSLVSENHFTNGNGSTLSEAATLTGKSPFTTHLAFSPNVLNGVDMFQHLPGLLKNSGYRTVSIAVPEYVDANNINLQNAFDIVNGIPNTTSKLSSFLASYGYANTNYLLTNVTERISDRLNHIFFLKDMQNVHANVTEFHGFDEDQERMDSLLSYLQEAQQSEQPLFAHVHLLATHGGRFYPADQYFSAGEEQTDNWMTDFYDDAILGTDSQVQQLVQFLSDNGQLENTILILYSDHGQKWTVTNRIPLIIRFPEGQFSGTVTANTQNLDIAPTILDYMGIQKPTWMDGTSLLEELNPNRLIFTTHNDSGEAMTIQCQDYYIFDQSATIFQTGQVEDYSNPCPDSALDSQDNIHNKIEQFLIERGYDLQSW